MEFPTNLKYATSDEWVNVEGNIATIGVSDFAQEQLSDVVYVDIVVSVGKNVEKGSVAATVESVKAAADVNMPVSGKIIAVNEDLSKSPELVNSEPYKAAWMIKVELSKPEELKSLMDGAAYKKYCEERHH